MNNAPSVYENSTKKHTIFVSGLPDGVNEQQLLDVFVSFGDIIEVQLPKEPSKEGQPTRHRGFAFLTFTSGLDADDAIANYDLNYWPGTNGGRVLKVNLARNTKTSQAPGARGDRAVWSSEQWLKEHALPISQSGGLGDARLEDVSKPVEEEVELEQ
ncbi:Cyclophilin-type peptidyl-prolyl cis-trans isomerase [Phaffia rhodozyma]|uniref:Cyclophilin-type peptidyl-prolyl cis-trans isomerase n=1 Tax=Phaffia rhodozyma TaxID=264483 RepID=A0A0F7SMP0_PHARH|nr:Cyclophilin-type peptidyl-prolyl cis-trans isomerase [Phaffia rhodozyma]